jgi:hypothetical protein
MRFQRFLFAVVVAACGCKSVLPRQPSTAETRPALLAALDGNWLMVGDVLGKPVKYRLIVEPILARTVTQLHMKDVQQPPQYEARLFLGYDRESGQVIAHWLDVFGAKGSIPHGTGQVTNNTIEFTIPYQKGPFRDTLAYDSATGRWRFTIESSEGSGKWKHFAAYEIARIK